MSAVTVYETVTAAFCTPRSSAGAGSNSPSASASVSVPSSSLSAPAASSSVQSSSIVSSPSVAPAPSSPAVPTTSAAAPTSSADAGVIPTKVLADLSTIGLSISVLQSEAAAYSANPNIANAEPLIGGNSNLVAAISTAVSDAQAVTNIGSEGASSVIAAVESLITASPGIRSLLDEIVAISSDLGAAGLAGVASNDLVTDRSGSGQLASALEAAAPAAFKAQATSLRSEIDALFVSALSAYGA